MFEDLKNEIDFFIRNLTKFSRKNYEEKNDEVVKEIYEEYKYGSSISKIVDDYDYDENIIKLAIIEYDRYRRPVYEKALTPEQFHAVYK